MRFLLPIVECLHMFITTTMITVKTNTLTMSNRRNNRMCGKWHRSSKTSRQRMTSRRASNQDSSKPQKINIMKMNLLIMNLSESVHQGGIGVTSKQLGMKRLKFITKPSQKVIGLMKLKCGRLILVGLASAKRQLRTKSVKLMPNNKKLIK
jgi:hypothetical protein